MVHANEHQCKSEQVALRNGTTSLQESNHHDGQDHEKKQMDEPPDGGELHDKRSQYPKNQQNNDDSFKHDKAP
jgi:hypothetical protein